MEHHQLNNENRRGAFIYTTSPFYGGENMECHGPDTTTTSMMALMTQNQDQQPQLHQRLMAPLPIHLLRGHESQSPQSFHLSSQSLKAEPAGFDRVVRSEHYRAHPGEVVAPRVYAMMLQSHEVENGSNNNTNNDDNAIKAKIVAHPQYSSLLEAYMDCQRVGAPPEVVDRLSAISRELETRQHSSASVGAAGSDPELDQFMEAYYDMLVKYREELTRPIQEATEFLRRIESELNSISNGSVRLFSSDDKGDGADSSEEDPDGSGGETELPEIDPRAEDRELKNHLLKKYSGYLGNLKLELSKKKKKGKLPKDARQTLLSWWDLHYKWPYPSETEKVALAESTGLDQKQINNWFINQRKRHWKPSEDMPYVVMDAHHSQNAALYIEGHLVGDGSYRLGP
ncbi:homeotic protein knotted-1 isoform X2 [Amborella trichopoda]|uniref:Uncharacterized protein n=1 Tax=Amborella trichopoda TaxID=13333 RepID=W1PKD2_AMBTC|nr:homeotic protein knotted-1 isoform X2 [Amborella trichopoda]ERN10462.1 hypothetical protein AMTR_s00026p00244220 [Amborella trichopoda]|eukprot:XP_006848881.1 homeotic protein knotted-1 isoform X2 [Amborella trichopoda]